MTEDEMEALMTAIRNAERCDAYAPDDEGAETCDGLDGCLDCLDGAARAAYKALRQVAK